MNYTQMTAEARRAELAALMAEYASCKEQGLNLDMSRGKPSQKQLDLSEGLLSQIHENGDCFQGKTDLRNYGAPDGVVALRKIFAELLEVPEDCLYLGNASSLNLMYDSIVRCLLFGAGEGKTPWSQQKQTLGSLKFLCPAPGYDRHFALCECFDIEMIPVAMTENGPDMDQVEALVKADPAIKGIWCVPKYQNPTGYTFSDETVCRLAAMETAADDFRIFWDNAYMIHDLYEEGDSLLNLMEACEKAGNPDRTFLFASFSKVTYPGGSVAVIAASKSNMAFIRRYIAKQTICADKLNQLRHALFFGSAEGVRAHMKKHAALLRPKFEAVEEIFEEQLSPVGCGSWTKPRGGYFLSLDLPAHTAKRTYDLCKEAGVTLTKVGETFPYGKDPLDRNLRIAPSFPEIADLVAAAKVLCLCAKIAYLETFDR